LLLGRRKDGIVFFHVLAARHAKINSLL
jgi:hypothetical protein